MLIVRPHRHGFTLVELMIGMAITMLALAWGVPVFKLWIQNTQNRTAAESVQNGLQMARAEAVRRNAVVRFNLSSASGAVAWSIGCVTVTTDCPETIQSRPSAEGTINARVGISTTAIPNPPPSGHFGTEIAAGTGLPAGVSFNGVGMVPSANAGTDFTRVDVTNATTSTARRMVVTVGSGGQIRMCDPAVSFVSNPAGCS